MRRLKVLVVALIMTLAFAVPDVKDAASADAFRFPATSNYDGAYTGADANTNGAIRSVQYHSGGCSYQLDHYYGAGCNL